MLHEYTRGTPCDGRLLQQGGGRGAARGPVRGGARGCGGALEGVRRGSGEVQRGSGRGLERIWASSRSPRARGDSAGAIFILSYFERKVRLDKG
eukprot:479253-Prorocentrum_minimum.AAC.2